MSTRVWQKSSYSNEGANCLNVAVGPGARVCVRESEEPGVVLVVTGEGMRSFVGAVKEGRLSGR